MKKIWLISLALLVLGGAIGGYKFWSNRQVESWEPSIRRFEESDRLRPPDPETIVFTGSSSIALWSSIIRPILLKRFG